MNHSASTNQRTSDSELTKIQELMYELRVQEIMTRPVVSIGAQDSMRSAKEVMRLHRISGIPVTDGLALAGIISVEDLIRWLESGAIDATVAEWMTRRVHTVRASDPAVHAINRFGAYKVGRLPVVDSMDRLVGIVTPGDIIDQVLRILDTLYREEESHRPRHGTSLDDLASDGTTVILRYWVAAGDLQKAGVAATRIKRILDGFDIEPQIVRRAGIAAYEAEMNLAIHTNRGGELRVEIGPDSLTIEARDDGPGIPNIEEALTPGFSTAPDWIHELGFGAGMGLNNVRRCADSFSMESQVGVGTTLRISIALAASLAGSRPTANTRDAATSRMAE